LAKQYGFVSVSDNLVPASDLAQIWPAMGLAGAMTSVDGGSYAGAHLLTTNATPVGGLNPYHGVTVIDAATPMSGSVPVFDPVWAYMCFQ